LTPDDVAEVVVFTAGRPENVVIADTLVFPNHQVRKRINDSSSSSNSKIADQQTGLTYLLDNAWKLNDSSGSRNGTA
jgi:3-hydroxy acid dehydrogenase/malonic semialdehyde reductase